MPPPLSPVSGNRQKAPPPPPTTTTTTATAAADSKYAPAPPAEISDGVRTYNVGTKLGRGGFAICYEAQVQGSGESVALKVVKTQMARKVEEKFRTELQIHSKLRHRHIAEFVRAFTCEERTFIVLELCSRGSLKEMLSHRKHLSSPEVRRFGVQILGALNYMHSRSIVHRDLKMANIFLDGNMEPKIGDFGLAAVLLSDDQMGVVRRTTLCGTPNYIAPEVLSKSQGHDTKADIWSFGVLVYVTAVSTSMGSLLIPPRYTLLVGTTPFSRPGDQHNNDVFARVKDTDYSWPDHCQNRVPAEAKALVKECLQSIDKRPGAEALVAHPFFSMSGGIPPALDRTHFREVPSFLLKRAPFEMRPSASRISLEALREECGLGQARNLDHGRSVYHEFLEEEAEKRTPVLPLVGIYTAHVPKFSKKPVRRQLGNIQRARSRPHLAPSQSETHITRVTTRSASATVINHDTVRRPPTEMQTEPESVHVGFIRADESFQVIRENAAHTEVERLTALGSTLSAYLRADGSTELPWPSEAPALPSVVERWCNYSNKYGIGYTLADGTVGCFFISPSKTYRAVVVPDAVQHYLHRGSSRELLRMNGPSACFVERQDRKKGGALRALLESPANFAVDRDGKTVGTSPANSPEVHERREALLLWSRFAHYMTSKLGSEALSARATATVPNALTSPSMSGSPANSADASFPVVYQRFGNVNAWAFAHGALQFDFPDHTKVVLSAGGEWIDFLHLDPDVSAALHSSDLPASTTSASSASSHPTEPANIPLPPSPGAITSYRASLRVPTRLFFNGPPSENRVLKEIARANELREKLGFVKDVVRMWARSGGVGSQSSDRLIWGGLGADWVVSGSEGGSGGRRVGWMGVSL